MEPIEWLDDKEKNGERFTNSECLIYCLKVFMDEKRVELWDMKQGFYKEYKTEAGALFEYDEIKSHSYETIMEYVREKFINYKNF